MKKWLYSLVFVMMILSLGMGSYADSQAAPAKGTVVQFGKLAWSREPIMAIDAAGNIWVNTFEAVMNGTKIPHNNIIELNSSGNIIATYPLDGGLVVYSISIDPAGNVWVIGHLGYTDYNLYEIVGVATGPQYSPQSTAPKP